ncbi:MAG: chemotaxis protein CheX [Bacteriovoracaceae bacterium]|jgi:CheY-specific phosphatase CheX|nr:chemotaxis protein CheX [Bacteriovoracaceae bacterium]
MANKPLKIITTPIKNITKDVLKSFVDIDINIANFESCELNSIPYNHIFSIPLIGILENQGISYKLDGHIALSFETPAYLNIASIILGETIEELNEDIEDLGLEIVNIILGKAKSVFEATNLTLQATSPKVIKNNTEFKYPKNPKVFSVTADCMVGNMALEVCYSFKKAVF